MPHAPDAAEHDSSRQWRSELLTRFSWSFFIGMAPLVTFALVSWDVAPRSRVATVLIVVVSAASALANRLDYRIRGIAIVAALFSLGTVLVHDTGPGPGVFLGYALGVALTVVLFGERSGFLVLAASVICFLAFGLPGRQESAALWAHEILLRKAWLRLAGALALFGGMLVVLISSALRRMERNEQRLRLALEAGRVGAWEWDFATGVVTRSDGTESLLGLPPGSFGGTLDAFRDAVLPEDREMVEKAIALVTSGQLATYQSEFRVQSDPPRWLESKGRVYRDGAGRPVLMRGTVADVSERKRSEQALRESEAELRALFASMEDVILVLDAQGRYVRIAPTNAALLYRPPDELLGRTLHEVFPPDRADAFLGQIHLCLQTKKTVRFEYELPIRGSVAWFTATVSPMTEDKVVWVARDETERRHADAALRESEERWRRISEATFEGIGFSQDGVLTDANHQLAEMLGYAVPELVGRPVTDLVAPHDRSRVMNAIRSGLTSGYQHAALCKDGSTLLVETRARSLSRHGRNVRVTAVRDVSEHHRLEAELRRQETLAAMGSLVAGVAHEVRTPLFSLSATLDALDAGVATPDQQQELKDLLRSQVRRLANLMQDLLDYGRPPKLRRTRVGIREAIQRAVRSCNAVAEKGAITLVLDVPDGLPDVDADLTRLEQVFENLLTNALQHAPHGSTVRLVARAVDGLPPGLTCAVEDEGPGISDSDLPRLFEPFFSRRKGGTGMGLAIAHRFVEAHGGSLVAANRPDRGAVFTAFLPAARESRAGGAVA